MAKKEKLPKAALPTKLPTKPVELPTIVVIDGWQTKTFVVERDGKKVKFLVKYKEHKTENVQFTISELYKDNSELRINFDNSYEDRNNSCYEQGIDICEMKIIALKSIITFLKTGALTIENLD